MASATPLIHLYTVLKRNVWLLLQYSVAGGTSFGVDLLCFYLLIRYTDIHYLVNTVIAFAMGTTLHFALTRLFVFRRAERQIKESYLIFLGVTTLGLALTTALMYVTVDVFDIEKVTARVLVAMLVGMLSFALHKKVSFKQSPTPHHVF